MDGLDGEDADSDWEHQIHVLAGEAMIFNEAGDTADFGALEEGQQVMVRGLLSFDDGPHLKAKLIKIGRFMHLRGLIESAPEMVDGVDGEYRFNFLPFSDDHESLIVRIVPETQIFDPETRSRLEPGDLEAGMRAVIEGVLDHGTGLFRAVLIVVKPPESGPEALQGMIQGDPGPDPESRTFTLTREDASDVAVKVAPGATILRVSQAEDTLSIMLIRFSDLVPEDRVRLFGHFLPVTAVLGQLPHFEAKVVVVEEGGE